MPAECTIRRTRASEAPKLPQEGHSLGVCDAVYREFLFGMGTWAKRYAIRTLGGLARRKEIGLPFSMAYTVTSDTLGLAIVRWRKQ
jgi:hypothetical protein